MKHGPKVCQSGWGCHAEGLVGDGQTVEFLITKFVYVSASLIVGQISQKFAKSLLKIHSLMFLLEQSTALLL